MTQDEVRQALGQLPPRTVRAILEQLAEIRARIVKGEKLEMPLITLHLHSSQSFVGWLLALGEDDRREKDGVLLQLHDPGSRYSTEDVLYVEVGAIVAVMIYNAPASINLLSKTWIGAPPGATAPTKLDIRRRTDEMPKQIKDERGLTLAYNVAWDKLTDEGNLFYWLGEAMNQVTTVLIEMLSDDFVKDTLSKALQTVRFTGGAAPAVRLEGTTLIIEIALSKQKAGYLEGYVLREAIEKVF